VAEGVAAREGEDGRTEPEARDALLLVETAGEPGCDAVWFCCAPAAGAEAPRSPAMETVLCPVEASEAKATRGSSCGVILRALRCLGVSAEGAAAA